MSAAAETLRRGWCPGALRPMPSGDGLLVRIKPVNGIVPVADAESIAALAQEHGNGLIELTSRGNIQLRGVTEASLGGLTSALDALGMLDATAEGEAVRNIIATPLAGIDRDAVDTRAMAGALAGRLATDVSLHKLPGKFGFLIDGGGMLPLGDVEGDICFVANGPHFAVGLAAAGGRAWVGCCAGERVVEVAAKLARRFISLGSEGRVRDLGLGERVLLATVTTLDPCDAPSMTAGQPIGLIASRDGAALAAGLGLPFGGITADQLRSLAALAGRNGAAELRLTPWRAVLVKVDDSRRAQALLAEAADIGFITDPGDARRAVAACPGAPACANASTAVRADAAAFAQAGVALLGCGAELHVSGCAKGCARRSAASLTLVGEGGLYGIVVNGVASMPGQLRLTPAEAVRGLANLSQAVTRGGDKDDPLDAAMVIAAFKETQGS